MNPLLMLLVEDNPGDVVLFQEALRTSGLAARAEVVDNGQEAMQFLLRQGEFGQALRPDVLVLDLNLPIKNGREVLFEMASDPDLNTIPVAILTTSTSETCVCDMYPVGRCAYFVKTDQFGRLQEIVQQIAAHAGAS